MSNSIKQASTDGANNAVATMEGVDQASDQVDMAKLFFKLMKKAEDAAQSST
ncbi:hypothetical protein [Duganella radicis]|uniref:Uncharacterized protein n=1 Tax=Duganella radicis TaxID=551988 RepID=A0A6L6PQV7_9BURK|nr:hypothetical protein [Duganella radicis]MTV41067.1 hypothetical protein [Duganella radicis]